MTIVTRSMTIVFVECQEPYDIFATIVTWDVALSVPFLYDNCVFPCDNCVDLCDNCDMMHDNCDIMRDNCDTVYDICVLKMQ